MGIRSHRLLQKSEGLSLDVGVVTYSMFSLLVNSPTRKDLVTAQKISSFDFCSGSGGLAGHSNQGSALLEVQGELFI